MPRSARLTPAASPLKPPPMITTRFATLPLEAAPQPDFQGDAQPSRFGHREAISKYVELNLGHLVEHLAVDRRHYLGGKHRPAIHIGKGSRSLLKVRPNARVFKLHQLDERGIILIRF